MRAGIQTTVQDYPGRPGMLAQGFFPAGPMDHFALPGGEPSRGEPRVGRRSRDDARQRRPADRVGLDPRRLRRGRRADPRRRADPALGKPAGPGGLRASDRDLTWGPGFRLYIAIGGGIEVPPLFGSRSTYTMGALGGHEGRALEKGDRLRLGGRRRPGCPEVLQAERAAGLRARVGDRGDPRPAGIARLLHRGGHGGASSVARGRSTATRTARASASSHSDSGTRGRAVGIAGGHPSNILDNSYPVGAMNVNGDLPVILGPDGPTAGGFVVHRDGRARRLLEDWPAPPGRRQRPVPRGDGRGGGSSSTASSTSG